MTDEDKRTADSEKEAQAIDLYKSNLLAELESGATWGDAKGVAYAAVKAQYAPDVYTAQSFISSLGKLGQMYKPRPSKQDPSDKRRVTPRSRISITEIAHKWFLDLDLQPGQSVTISPALLAAVARSTPAAWRNAFYATQRMSLEEMGYTIDASGNDAQFTIKVTAVAVPQPAQAETSEDDFVELLAQMARRGYQEEALKLLDMRYGKR